MSTYREDFMYYSLTGCELSSFTFRDEQRVRVFENKMRVRMDGTT